MESLGLKVSRLIRVAFGPFELGPIAECAVKEVETPALRKALGPEIIKLAEADFDAPLGDEEERVPAKGKPERGKAARGKHERGRAGREERDGRRHGEGKASHRHPEARARDTHEPRRMAGKAPGPSSFEARQSRAPQADAERPENGRHKHKKRRRPDRSSGPRPKYPRPK